MTDYPAPTATCAGSSAQAGNGRRGGLKRMTIAREGGIGNQITIKWRQQKRRKDKKVLVSLLSTHTHIGAARISEKKDPGLWEDPGEPCLGQFPSPRADLGAVCPKPRPQRVQDMLMEGRRSV